MAQRDLGPWTYTADDGRAFVRRADKFLTGQLDTDDNPIVGGASAATLTPYEPMPANFRPRMVACSGSGGYKARVVIYDPTTFASALAGSLTINVRDASGTSHSVTSYAGTPERLGRKIGRGQ